MNRNEFLIVTGLSGLVVILLLTQLVFVHWINDNQSRAMQANQILNKGEICMKNLQQVALRTAQISQQTGDQGLKDLMARQQIAINAPQGQSSSPGAATPAPAPTPTH